LGIVVVGGVWYFRDELKNTLKRITGIGFNELKFGPPPEQQIPSSPSTVAAQELPSPSSKPGALAPKPNLDTFIERIKSFISGDQLDPVLQRLRADLVPTAGPDTSDQIEILMYLVASLTVQVSHERNYTAILGSQLNLLAQASPAGGITTAMANALYEQAKAVYPQVYTTFRFDQWIGFLINAGLLAQIGEAYVLTNFGRGFLKYIVDRQLAVNKLAWTRNSFEQGSQDFPTQYIFYIAWERSRKSIQFLRRGAVAL
jgi:hypothetical protein